MVLAKDGMPLASDVMDGWVVVGGRYTLNEEAVVGGSVSGGGRYMGLDDEW